MMNLNLKLGEFDDNLVCRHTHPCDPKGIKYVFIFPNRFGASVIKCDFSCGHEDDLWELAVMTVDGLGWHKTYNTEITPDVEGWLTNDDVLELLGRIRDLKTTK